ncbi:TPA: hypothetical protein DEB00_03995 [Candidatus Uhrbacteria bacterium]|nr:hypothetical protein [Candidatus Uhrbacteria bacterium]
MSSSEQQEVGAGAMEAADKALEAQEEVMRKEYDQINESVEEEMGNLLNAEATIYGAEKGLEEDPQFKFSKEIFSALVEHHGDPAAIREAVGNVEVPLHMKLGTAAKIQRLLDSPKFDRMLELGKLLGKHE